MAARLAIASHEFAQPENAPAGGVLRALSADVERSGAAATSSLLPQLEQGRRTLQRQVEAYPALAPALRALCRTDTRLRRPLRLVLMGEINTGKTALANLLIGARALPSRAISNTTFPTLIRYAEQPCVWVVDAMGRRRVVSLDTIGPLAGIRHLEVGLPMPPLRLVEVVDLPGFADPRSDEVDLDDVVHRADLAIWCTMGTQAWKESEHVRWLGVPDHLRRQGLLVATHKDLLRPGEEEKLAARLRKEAGHQFRAILMLATLQASEATAPPPSAGEAAGVWTASGAGSLSRELGVLVCALCAKRIDTAKFITQRITNRALESVCRLLNDRTP